MFIVVKHKSVIEAIPAAWAVFDPNTQNETVYWPRKNLKAKRFDNTCIPDIHDSKEWFAGKEAVIKRNFETWEEANAEADRLLNYGSGAFESENDPTGRFTRENQHSVNLVQQKVVFPNKVYTVSPNRLPGSTHMAEMTSTNFTQSSTSNDALTSTITERNHQYDGNFKNEFATTKPYISENGKHSVFLMSDYGSHQPLKVPDNNGLQYQNFGTQHIITPAVDQTTSIQPNLDENLYFSYPKSTNLEGRDRVAEILLSNPDQATTIAGDQPIINILTKLTNQVVTLQRGMELLLAGKTDGTVKCPNCFHCNPSLLDESQSMQFEKIKSEDALTKLENSLQDEDYRQKFIKFCFSIIGTERKKDDLGTCCLELSREIFDKTFWSQTTWLGTIQTGGTKFSLCKHEIFLDFFKFVICKATSTTPAKQYFSQFFQGRAKNCLQYLRANDSHHPGQRKRAKTAASGCI